MRIAKRINGLNVEAYTDGHPHWTTITHNDVEIRLHHEEIPDLIYALNYVLNEIKKHEDDIRERSTLLRSNTRS